MDRRQACALSLGQQQPTDRAGGERRRGRGQSWVVPIAGGVGLLGGLSRGGPFGPSWFMLPIGPSPLPALGCPGQVMGLSMASANLVDCGAPGSPGPGKKSIKYVITYRKASTLFQLDEPKALKPFVKHMIRHGWQNSIKNKLGLRKHYCEQVDNEATLCKQN